LASFIKLDLYHTCHGPFFTGTKKSFCFTQNLTLNLEPVYGIILAFVVYKENEYLSDGFYFGFALILLAVVLQMMRIVRTRQKEIKLVGD
jgi:hypothetical protein